MQDDVHVFCVFFIILIDSLKCKSLWCSFHISRDTLAVHPLIQICSTSNSKNQTRQHPKQQHWCLKMFSEQRAPSPWLRPSRFLLYTGYNNSINIYIYLIKQMSRSPGKNEWRVSPPVLHCSSTNHPNFNVIRYLNPLKPRISFCQCAVKQSRPLSFYFQIRKETKLLLTSTRPSSFLCPWMRPLSTPFSTRAAFLIFIHI